MKVTSNRQQKPIGQQPHKQEKKDPGRKRTFDPEPQTVELLKVWEKRNPGVRFGWMVNRALQAHLAGCALKG